VLTRTPTLTEAHSYQRFRLGDILLKARMYSKPLNGSLSQLVSPDPHTREMFSRLLGDIHHEVQIGKAYAPSPIKFTDRIADPDELTVPVPIGKYTLYRNPERPADGVPLKSGEGCFISPSSCPTTVMVSGDKALVLHTGRDCLIDRHGLEHGSPAPGREHGSIIFTALHYLGKPEQVQVKVLWSTPPHLFVHDLDHPTYGKINERMHHVVTRLWGSDSVPKRGNKFHLDLPKLVRDQCMSRGVPEDNIDLRHAYQPPSGTWLDGKAGTPRNLVVVSRHS
jgi:hypothetical protein